MFEAFPKIARLSRDMVITEKLDGTNAQIYIYQETDITPNEQAWGEPTKFKMKVGSRSRWLGEHEDNHGFYHWVLKNQEELFKLGEGRHFGEWWGCGIQRGYGLKEKKFSLFNTHRWSDPAIRPKCCEVVPVLYEGEFSTAQVAMSLMKLAAEGSKASPGFMKPEGIVVFHKASNTLFKKTIEKDEEPKGKLA